jgi:hypothetical protein
MRLAVIPRQCSRDDCWNLISADSTARKDLAALQRRAALRQEIHIDEWPPACTGGHKFVVGTAFL